LQDFLPIFAFEFHDSEQITTWFADYKFEEMGLWLPDGW
jgi:hypothetical protein